MSFIVTLVSLLSFGLLVVLVLQMRSQRRATDALIEENRIRTGLYENADESTTYILARTIRNVSAGETDASLDSDLFTLRVVRELIKRKLNKEKWLEIQSNQRLVHELFLLLRDVDVNVRPQPAPPRETRFEAARDRASGE